MVAASLVLQRSEVALVNRGHRGEVGGTEAFGNPETRISPSSERDPPWPGRFAVRPGLSQKESRQLIAARIQQARLVQTRT